MSIFTISDNHFQNENIIRYCGRPFEDAAHAQEVMINNWNLVVQPEDTVVVCGDFIMGSPDGIPDILNRLNGSIILVRGNHDTDRKIERFQSEFSDKIIEVCDTKYITYRGYYWVFCHFPLVNAEFGMMVSARHADVVYVHGHVHNSCPHENPEFHAFNVSADVINFTPIKLTNLAKVADGWKGRV